MKQSSDKVYLRYSNINELGVIIYQTVVTMHLFKPNWQDHQKSGAMLR